MKAHLKINSILPFFRNMGMTGELLLAMAVRHSIELEKIIEENEAEIAAMKNEIMALNDQIRELK